MFLYGFIIITSIVLAYILKCYFKERQRRSMSERGWNRPEAVGLVSELREHPDTVVSLKMNDCESG